MMYGFGDDPSPYKESVDLVEVHIQRLLPTIKILCQPVLTDALL